MLYLLIFTVLEIKTEHAQIFILDKNKLITC